MPISLAFLILAFLAAVLGASLIYVPAGLITAAVLFAVAGIALIEIDQKREQKQKGRP